MIPKVIHYCWFGGNPLPDSAKRCISSWRKFLPNYEIKEWNESNYDVHKIPYIHEAYESKKYAFVSDYARFDVLYQYGGIYFDTDVQVISSMDEIIARGAFMGREAGAWLTVYGRPNGLAVAPGLALGVESGHGLYKEILDVYEKLQFRLTNGSLNTKTICWHIAEIMLSHGLTDNNDKIEEVENIWIYPADVFCPMDHTRGNELKITERTVSIHHYDCTWLDKNTTEWRMHKIKQMLSSVFGTRFISKIANIIKGRKI